MKIRLQNIGIVKESTISIDGLTVITGKNNSGKTTVGKTLYSLIDATANILSKSRVDRAQYISKKLDDILEDMDFLRFVFRAYEFDEKDDELACSYLSKFSHLKFLLSGEYRHDIPLLEIESFARNLYEDLTNIDVQLFCDEVVSKFGTRYAFAKDKKQNKEKTEIFIRDCFKKVQSMLEELFVKLSKDPQLIDYTRESINQTLRTEFAGQIQPAKIDVDYSKIELFNEDTLCFDIKIAGNKVLNENKPVFLASPYKKTYFIDDPYIVDDTTTSRRNSRMQISDEPDSFLKPNNIVPHNFKLKYVLRSKPNPSILEQTFLNDALQKIKEEISKIIPGTFEFSNAGDYYVQNGKKLKVSNLATGSKMFSIIKILLEKGELDKSTLLVLDEPEAHLHPQWQNNFAEMIVLLVKELGVNILLTTHSSNFVLALDAYMRKYQIQHLTNFYQTKFSSDEMVEYECVNENMNDIYNDFLQYLSEVKMLRDYIIRNAGETE